MASSSITKAAIGAKTKELLRKQTIEKITVRTICEQTGVDRKTFYRYFKDKYEVIEWIYYHDYFEKMAISEDLGMWSYFTMVVTQAYSDRDFFLNAFHFQGQNSFRDYFIDLFMPIAINEYGACFSSEEQAKFFIRQTLYLIFDEYEIWLNSSPCSSPEEFSKEFKTDCLKFYQVMADHIQASFEHDKLLFEKE